MVDRVWRRSNSQTASWTRPNSAKTSIVTKRNSRKRRSRSRGSSRKSKICLTLRRVSCDVIVDRFVHHVMEFFTFYCVQSETNRDEGKHRARVSLCLCLCINPSKLNHKILFSKVFGISSPCFLSFKLQSLN